LHNNIRWQVFAVAAYTDASHAGFLGSLYTGDGIFALFGAPIAHEDHSQRTLYTTLHM